MTTRTESTKSKNDGMMNVTDSVGKILYHIVEGMVSLVAVSLSRNSNQV